MNRLLDDPRIDPRLKDFFQAWVATPIASVRSREELLLEETAESSLERHREMCELLDSMECVEERLAGRIEHQCLSITSTPDNNQIPLYIDRPPGNALLPCVYYLHGGAMQILSAQNGNYRAWARMIAAHGVTVVMPDFRNCVLPSTVPEIAPYPAGLNDCVSGLRYLYGHARELNIDPARIVVAGESGGGNLALATAVKLNRDGAIRMLGGVYVLCPFIAGRWPSPEYPSSVTNNLILMDTHHNRARVAYGVAAFEARDPLAWPGFASETDVRGLPPVVISVNECDPLRDEGVGFYRLLLRAGVAARCREILGTTHAAELFPKACPEISAESAQAIAHFAIAH